MGLARNLSKFKPNSDGLVEAGDIAEGAIPPGAGVLTAVATGSLSDGNKVVINTDGTVSAVSGNTNSVGTTGSYVAATVFEPRAAFDPVNNKVVVVYSSSNADGNRGTAVVGTVSGTSISFGTPVVFTSGYGFEPCPVYDPVSGNIVVLFGDGGSRVGKGIVGTVSGTSISFGSATTFETGLTGAIDAVYDVANNKIVVSYYDGNNGNYITAAVGTVSGTSISFGTPVVPRSQQINTGTAISYDSSVSKVLITAVNANDGTLEAYIGTVSGTSISFNNTTGISSATIPLSMKYDPINNVNLLASGNSTITLAFLRISGTSVNQLTSTSFSGGYPSIGYNPTTNVMAVSYSTTPTGTGEYRRIVLGAASISVQSPTTIATNITNNYLSLTYDTTSNQAIAAYTTSGNGFGVPLVVQNTNLLATNYIGISSGSYTNGQTATVQTVGSIDDAQSSLTAGRVYYVQTNGTLSTTAGTPSVIAGTAVSATKLIIKG